MQAVAIGALVTDLTHSAAWGGLVAGASFLSSGLITPFGGVVADHHDRRRLMLMGEIVLAAVATLLAILYSLDLVGPVVLLIMVIVEGFLLGLIIPAQGALLPDLVPRDRLADASALGNASWNLGRCIGPALAGAVITWGSYGLVFIINAVSYVLVGIAIAFIRVKPTVHPGGGSMFERLREGIRGARAEEGCWSALRFIGITALLVSPFIAMIPAVAQLVFDGTAVDTAHFTMAQGLGSVVGAFALASAVRRFGRYRVMVVLLIALPLSEMAFAVSPNAWAAMLCVFLLGAGYVAITVGMTVIVQLRAPRHVRARVLALNFMTLSLVYAVGAAMQGRLADWFGIRQTLFVAPAMYLVVLGTIALRSPQWFRSLGDLPSETPTTNAEPATVEP
jgi:MFS family permease